MKLLYICTWDKCKEKTFSGTTYFLFKALQSKIQISDLDVSLNKFEKKINKLFGIKFINGRTVYIGNFNKLSGILFQKKINNAINKNNNDIVLQIGSYGLCKNDYYTYQDLSIDSLLYFRKKKPELFKYSGFQDIPFKDLNYKREKQMEVYNKAKGIFTMSKWLANNLIEYTNIKKDKVHAIGAGININRDKIKKVSKNNRRILFVGRDFFRKGGDITYAAFKILREKYVNDAELYVAGPREWPLNEKIEGVTFLGDVSYDKLSNYFNMCDIFCLPSRFEAYGIVFAEALVYGLPCIGRNEFAMKEFIQDSYNGYLIDNDDEEVLALKMADLLNNRKIKNEVLENRENYIKMYSWDTVAEKIISTMRINCKNN